MLDLDRNDFVKLMSDPSLHWNRSPFRQIKEDSYVQMPILVFLWENWPEPTSR